MAQTWWWDLRIKGGYTPEDTAGCWPWMGISVYQDQNKDGVAELIQGWNLEWTNMGPDPQCACCSCDIWRGVPAWCGNKVCLDSNQYPVLMGGLENWVSEHYPSADGEVFTEIPGKEVYIEFGLKFSGCPLDEQEFAYRYQVGPFDTEAGEIELIDYYFPYIDEVTGELLPLPLCITNEMAQTWWWDLRIKGGYTPEDTAGCWPWMGISFYQDQNKDGIAELIQGWNLEWFDMGKDPNCDCCSCNIWRGIPAWCGNKVCLDSNQYPVLMGGLENWVSEHYPFDGEQQLTEIPGKEVTIEFGLKFSGCPLDVQEFAYILAQKKDVISPTFPNSRVEIK
jgi:hypothetical protein